MLVLSLYVQKKVNFIIEIFKQLKQSKMKRNDLKEISEQEFVAVLGMMQNEYFLVDWDRFEIGSQIESRIEKYSKIEDELITDITGMKKYSISFTLWLDTDSKLVYINPNENEWGDILQTINVFDIELFDLEENQINTTAEQRLKMATIIQERLTIKS